MHETHAVLYTTVKTMLQPWLLGVLTTSININLLY